MKKKFHILLALPIILLLVACNMANTPTSKVEELFSKYQKLDNDIDVGINDVLVDQNMSESQKERYRGLLEKQYKNLSYEVLEELVDGDTATVMVEVEVIDYKRSINDLVFDNTVQTKEQYDDEKLNRLEDAKEKVTYTLELGLTKDSEGIWRLNALTNEDIKKIQGMY